MVLHTVIMCNTLVRYACPGVEPLRPMQRNTSPSDAGRSRARNDQIRRLAVGGGADSVMSASAASVVPVLPVWWMGLAASVACDAGVIWRVLNAAQGSESDGIGVSVF